MKEKEVASFTDAWIETTKLVTLKMMLRSHLLQMRGLKLYGRYEDFRRFFVASFTDAWIETGVILNDNIQMKVASFTDAWIETFSRIRDFE